MRVLVVGGGGREHALIWKIRQSAFSEEIFCAPGNGGIDQDATCVNINVTDIKKLAQFAENNVIDLTIVGPELPLTLGIVDHFQSKGLTIFGPTSKAAALEGSKEFSKDFMKKYEIPTASYRVFSKAKDAIHFIHGIDPPFVVKADGLAAGKGVIICYDRIEGYDAIEMIMKKKAFGKSGKKVVIEEFLQGEEASILAITDGKRILVLPPSQDHKAVFEGDKGPNTGGMGAYAPTPVISKKMSDLIYKDVLEPTIKGMEKENRPYSGVLYAGLMLTKDGIKVLEYNCRFGDPETQAVLPLVKTDLLDLMLQTAEGRIREESIQTYRKSAVCVVMAAGGYPGSYEKENAISGISDVSSDVSVFHAGTKSKKGKLLTSGGRVLGVTAVGTNLKTALEKVYQGVEKITFKDAYYRRDIAHRAIKKRNKPL